MTATNEPTSICKVCLRDTKDGTNYHPACLKRLFGSTALPKLDLDLGSLNDMAQKMVGRMSISGVQQKALVSLTADRKRI